MITNIRLEVLPRYGGKIGMVWISEMDEEGKGNTDVVGSIRIQSDEELELWTKIIEKTNEEIQEKLQEEKLI